MFNVLFNSWWKLRLFYAGEAIQAVENLNLQFFLCLISSLNFPSSWMSIATCTYLLIQEPGNMLHLMHGVVTITIKIMKIPNAQPVQGILLSRGQCILSKFKMDITRKINFALLSIKVHLSRWSLLLPDKKICENTGSINRFKRQWAVAQIANALCFQLGDQEFETQYCLQTCVRGCVSRSRMASCNHQKKRKGKKSFKRFWATEMCWLIKSLAGSN